MRETIGPPLRAAALIAFLTGVALLLLNPPSFGGLEDLLSVIAVAAAIILVTAWATVALIGREAPEPEFQRLVEWSERLGTMPPPERTPDDFDELVIAAIDDLPPEFRDLLAKTPVTISNRGAEHGAYGLYMGGTIARDGFPDRIVIFQDTLERDFGGDPDLLRAQVERTLRHELAHHLGWDEPGVRNLGL